MNKSDNSHVQMYIDSGSGNNYELTSIENIENMPVDSNSKSDVRDLSDFNPGDDNTENSLVEFEQEIRQN